MRKKWTNYSNQIGVLLKKNIVFIFILSIHLISFVSHRITHKTLRLTANMMTCNSSFLVFFLLLRRCFRFDTVHHTLDESWTFYLFSIRKSLKHTFVSCMNCYVTETVRRYGFTFRFGLLFFVLCGHFFLFFTFVDVEYFPSKHVFVWWSDSSMSVRCWQCLFHIIECMLYSHSITARKWFFICDNLNWMNWIWIEMKCVCDSLYLWIFIKLASNKRSIRLRKKFDQTCESISPWSSSLIIIVIISDSELGD